MIPMLYMALTTGVTQGYAAGRELVLRIHDTVTSVYGPGWVDVRAQLGLSD